MYTVEVLDKKNLPVITIKLPFNTLKLRPAPKLNSKTIEFERLQYFTATLAPEEKIFFEKTYSY